MNVTLVRDVTDEIPMPADCWAGIFQVGEHFIHAGGRPAEELWNECGMPSARELVDILPEENTSEDWLEYCATTEG